MALTLAGRAVAANPASPAFTASQVQALCLFNFAEFVEWPDQAFADADESLTIGILGHDPFGPLLNNLVTGEKIHGRRITVQHFAGLAEVSRCHILFICQSEEERLHQILTEVAGRHILTVSAIQNFARRGGIIELVSDSGHIRFRIALHRAREESLTISAKLLRPAEVVYQSAPRRSCPFSKVRGSSRTPRRNFFAARIGCSRRVWS